MFELGDLLPALLGAVIASAGFLAKRYFEKRDEAGAIEFEMISATARAELLASQPPPPDAAYYSWSVTVVVFVTHSGNRPVPIRQDKVRGLIEANNESIRLSWGDIRPEQGSEGIISSGSDVVVRGPGRLIIRLSGACDNPPPEANSVLRLIFSAQIAGANKEEQLTQRLNYVGDGPHYDPGGWMLGDPSDQPFRQWSGTPTT